MRSSYAKSADLALNFGRKRKIKLFQKYYQAIVAAAAKALGQNLNAAYLKLTQRSLIINCYERVTGNAILYIVDKILHARPHFSSDQIYLLAQDFAHTQNLRPEEKVQLQTLPRKYQITSAPRPDSSMAIEEPEASPKTTSLKTTSLKTTSRKASPGPATISEAQKRCRSYLDQIITIVRQNREGI
jgi:hypothetical protein